MAGIEEFIKGKKEFKESYEGLKNEPNLITVDGPDGVGKTTISRKVVEKLKEKLKNEGKDPNNVVYFKYINLIDTKSQETIDREIRSCKDKTTGLWDKSKIEHLIKLFSAKLNRSYHDHVVPLIKANKIVVVDRSEVDMFRACLEWGNEELLNTVIQYMKSGTLTNGISAGNRIFVYSNATDIHKNLSKRKENLSPNDPRSLADVDARIKKEAEAENLIAKINEAEETNIIKIEHKRIENEEGLDIKFEKIAEEIINKLKLKEHE
ncbi:MAG: hypothetical protein WC793_03265 [Candidatus Paceibacterota bacterium]|jgi:thymidylate kinase